MPQSPCAMAYQQPFVGRLTFVGTLGTLPGCIPTKAKNHFCAGVVWRKARVRWPTSNHLWEGSHLLVRWAHCLAAYQQRQKNIFFCPCCMKLLLCDAFQSNDFDFL